jgi:pimeloyl-ACP methyl ester carboxylesterase
MPGDRIHRAVSADGTEIAGRVEGQGPPLVLVHGPVHDGDMAWATLLPLLTEQFTCYLPSLRGRGLSGDNPDHSPPRFQEDVNAFVDSIGEPVCLFGWSDGGSLALGAAAPSESVVAVAAFEPSVYPLMREDDLAAFGATVEQWSAATVDGRLIDAAHIFHRYVCTDDEYRAVATDYLHRQARLFPLLAQEIQQAASYEGPQPTDPEVLARIEVPVLILLAQQTRLDTWFTDSAQHVAQHVTDSHIRELPDVGHFAPLVAPEPIAKELISFFAAVRRPEPA